METPPDVITKIRKKRPAQKGTQVVVRLQPLDLAALDTWIAAQPEPRPTRAEAMRRFATKALRSANAESIPNAFKRDQRRLGPDTVEFFVWSVPTAFQIIKANSELDAAEM